MKRTAEFWQSLRLRTKIMAVCAVMFLVSLAITFRLSVQTGRILDRLEASNAENRTLLTLLETLNGTQADVGEYLNTRSTVTLESWYEHAQQLREQTASFQRTPVSDRGKIIEKNIAQMTDTYLALCEQAVSQKRGRDIDAYQATYTELSDEFRYLTSMISTLNNIRQQETTLSSDQILESAQGALRSNMMIVALIAALDVFLLLVLGRIRDPAESAMLERTIRMESQMKDAELKYLRAQIDPHFLFNTLNAGAQVAMMEEADTTYRYLLRVADFYRYLVRQENAHLTLKAESDLIDDYMYIINVRYAGDILYEKELQDVPEDYPMPGMVLQPIVENAIKHGLSELPGDKRLSLTACCEGETLCIRIHDNGKGMDAQLIPDILQPEDDAEQSTARTEQKKTEESSGTGIGLKNVLRRLRMYYRKEDVMEIESNETGTTVLLKLPLSFTETPAATGRNAGQEDTHV